ncbi:MAG: hypothetical protein ABS79_04215 [Planctomycetes bacterium SCN 63-9]|nr:MAG: hypothetical protein ABS79_04215 [Planctomycetes bacterium SCN 63-9]
MSPIRLLRVGGLALGLLLTMAILSIESGCGSGSAGPGPGMVGDPPPVPPGSPFADDSYGPRKTKAKPSRSRSAR